jgi:hypothetical protein
VKEVWDCACQGDDTEGAQVTDKRTVKVKEHNNWTGWNANANEGLKEIGREGEENAEGDTEGDEEKDRNQDPDKTSKKLSSSNSVLSSVHEHKEFRECKSRTKIDTLHRTPCAMRHERTYPANLINLVRDSQYIPYVQHVYSGADDQNDPVRR